MSGNKTIILQCSQSHYSVQSSLCAVETSVWEATGYSGRHCWERVHADVSSLHWLPEGQHDDITKQGDEGHGRKIHNS